MSGFTHYLYFHSPDGKCSTFETEYQWSLIVGLGLTVPVLAVILVLALIAICYNGPFGEL